VHSAILWPFHRLHHSGTRLSPLTASRNNPLEVAFEQFLRVWPIVLCPISLTSFLTLNSLLYLHSTIHHIDVPWTWGWFGRWILVSPQGHRIHHSPIPEHFNKNLGTWAFWDHLFGTWYDGTLINDEVGLGEPLHNNRNLLIELGADVLDFGKRILHRSDVQAPASELTA
jgi:sterol desaturase/sphingolipid hydroxylase (fatty acid hydroxylase superfamily)